MQNRDDFDLDVQALKSQSAEPKITSYALCTPGTCNSNCNATAWLCSNACITRTCLTCVN